MRSTASLRTALGFILGASALLIAPAQTRARDDAPRVIAGKNGEAEVIFDNDCVVYFDDRGRRKRSLPACSSHQLERADDAITRHRREQGTDTGHGGGSHHRGHDAPKVVEKRHGEAEVVFGDDCVVYFDDRGRRKRSQPACSSRQLDRADDAIARHRREQGHDEGRHHGSHDWERHPPEVTRISSHGALEIKFRNDCTVRYDGRGKLRLKSPECSDEQVKRAHDAADSYRREQRSGAH